MEIEKNGIPVNVSLEEVPKATGKNEYYPGIWNQYYATFAICVATLSVGSSGGWVSPVILILKDENDSPVGKMSDMEISLLETLPAFAALLGTAVFAGLIDRFGRKKCGYFAGGFIVAGWLFLISATYKMHLYIGRFLNGMANVGLAMLGPIYLSEIADVSIRGSLMTYTQFAGHCGWLLSFLLGTLCEYRLLTAICMIGPLLFPLAFYWIPESPHFLMLKSRTVEARNSLLWYRGGDEKLVDDELLILAKITKGNYSCSKVLQNKGNRKAILIFLFLFCFSVLSGTSVISGYASQIFFYADSVFDPNTSAAIMASMKLIASLIAVQLVDRFGRKVLVLFSYICMSLSLIVLTIYSYLNDETNVDVSNIGWLPIVCLSFYVSTNTLGVGTVGEVIAGEMLTPEIKGVAIGFVGIVGTVVTLGSLQAYPIFVNAFGSYFNFFVESIFAVLAIFISWRIVPETKGKTIAEISDILNGNTPYVNRKTEVTKL